MSALAACATAPEPVSHPVTAVVAGTIAVRREELPSRVLERLRLDLSFPNPEYLARRRLYRELLG